MWNRWAQKPIDSAQQMRDWIREAAQSGTAASRSMLGSLPFCASLVSAAQTQAGDPEEDLIHYFLMPCPVDDSGYMLFSKRQLPQGTGTENDLPKFSVFHVPNEGADRKLEELVLDQLSRDTNQASPDDDEPLDQRLERIAGQIEKHSNYATFGIILIGGTVAIANPLLGVGIVAQAIFPSIGGVVSSEAMKIGGSKLRRWRERGDKKRADKQAKDKLNERKARLILNPFLAKLQRAIDTEEHEFDPGMQDPFLRDAKGLSQGLRVITIQVMSEYSAQIKQAADEGRLGPEDRRWLDMLQSYAKLQR